MVIVGGGDGTLSKTIDYFMGTGTVFALLPLGTANSFARTLGIPLDLDGAVDVIANGVPRAHRSRLHRRRLFRQCRRDRPVAAGREEASRTGSSAAGRLGYALWAGWSADNFGVPATVDDGRRAHRCGRPKHGSPTAASSAASRLVDTAELDSGEIIIQAVSRQEASVLELAGALSSSAQAFGADDSIREFHGHKLRIETRPPMDVAIDGELSTKTPITVSVAPDAVLIAAPRPLNPPD